MWHVDKKFTAAALEALPLLGFQVRSTGGVMRAEKYGCAAEFRRLPDGLYQMTIPPSILHQGQFTQLWDAGYQKFLVTDDKHKIPALASHLQSLRSCNEELRTALGVPAYYNDGLGSTCQVTVYDRVQGRPGDNPDTTLGIKEDSDT
jgi:hypothetical protein